ncbi:MAG TPA: energy transducer TonB [Verrucomicrobiae bacterium]|nr:energy transducer TonB [Verrucomicrobiae bacterium]
MNLAISFTFHAALVLVLLYFAARSGILGDQLKKITIQMVKEQKPPPKPKPPPPPPPPPKIVAPKVVAPPKVMAAKAPPPAAPIVAPPAQVLPSFDFGGGRAVATSSDPVQLYKGAIQYAFQSKWNRPDNIDDARFVDEIQVDVSRDGQISNPQWEKSSGNATWDESVRKAIQAVTSMDAPPPTNFPPKVVIRFDVQDENDSMLQ